MADKKIPIIKLPGIKVDGPVEWSILRARKDTARYLQREIDKLAAEIANIEAERERLLQRAADLAGIVQEKEQQAAGMRAYMRIESNDTPSSFDYDIAYQAIEAGIDQREVREQFQRVFPGVTNDAFRAAMYYRRQKKRREEKQDSHCATVSRSV